MNFQSIQAFVEAHPGLFIALTLWTLIWKGLALWKAAGRGDRNWFIILLVLNTMGLLDIIYYYFVGKKTEHHEETL